ncbi:hypothetical protein SAMN05444682_103480 [Parapedobacter indicus]|uniref:Uncharacterized protein n=1 Tax=Parapedobacter indicus TaxID=1477437 RepID=A0A1I3HSV5_9SPHI|nr:hypothetical protein CLV26_103481 [Parapedobacter indicus]SFI38805.1 hypothetical protein SAMN05444682_103480 [Parapedobacter indicus]
MMSYPYPALERAELIDLVPLEFKSLLDVGYGYEMFGKSVKKQRKDVTVWGVEQN